MSKVSVFSQQESVSNQGCGGDYTEKVAFMIILLGEGFLQIN